MERGKNGCICCTLREDLLKEVERLSNEERFDYILIESTGISEPVPVAQTFTYADEENGIDLSSVSRLDCMVTVVDANRFWHDYASGESLLDRKQALGEDDSRDVVDLLIDQIEFCDVLLLNKCDLVSMEDLLKLESVLRKLQPKARIIRTTHGQVDPKEILNTELFNFEEASLSAGWIQELQKEHHTAETEEYGIRSFVYRRRKPFHPSRLAGFFQDWPEEIVRAKGMVWIATRNSIAGSISQAGPSIQFGVAGQWIASVSDEEQEAVKQDEPELQEHWDSVWGDRINEIVIIGMDMDDTHIIEQLDACLLSDDEMQFDWKLFEDPLPIWQL